MLIPLIKVLVDRVNHWDCHHGHEVTTMMTTYAMRLVPRSLIVVQFHTEVVVPTLNVDITGVSSAEITCK